MLSPPSGSNTRIGETKEAKYGVEKGLNPVLVNIMMPASITRWKTVSKHY